MSKVITQFIALPIILVIIFIPVLSLKDFSDREAVEITLNEKAKEAAIKGEFSPDIKESILSSLEEKYHFNREHIKLITTSEKKGREEYLQASITIPRSPIFVLNIFGKEPTTYTYPVEIMSEYLD
ncbi:hypothetical protein [Bacillus safensis]|uniref:hypothetical protein n=1 Tax=Bacillus TaxID=1386 RepID=UPI002E25015D|nr:hypothetical protein [Bacillus safensis]